MTVRPLKILYAAYARMPTEKAHGIQIASMCAALAHLGHEVELVVPERANPITEDPFSYYGIKPSFKITFVPTGYRDVSSRFRFMLGELAFARTLKAREDLAAFDAVITRSAFVTWLLSSRAPVFFEMHDFPLRFHPVWRFLLRGAKGLISTNRWKAKRLGGLLARGEKDILVAPNGYDEALFASLPSSEEARRRLGLPSDARIILYTGNVYAWKGVELLASVAASFPEAVFLFVGGSGEAAKKFAESHRRIPNVRHIAHQPHATIPVYLRAADILVLPNSAATEESRLGTSPIKLFEYLASSTPAVVADLPATREVVDEQSASFFLPDDSESLRAVIADVLSDLEAGRERARRARSLSVGYSWTERARKVSAFVAQTRA